MLQALKGSWKAPVLSQGARKQAQVDILDLGLGIQLKLADVIHLCYLKNMTLTPL